MMTRTVAGWTVTAILITLAGCAAGKLVGGMAQSHEYQKLVDTPAKYQGLEDKSIAVMVNADLATLYEHQDLTVKIAGGISARLLRDVPGARVLDPQHVINWQYRTPQWNALPLGDVAEALQVDRVVHIDVQEYRLNPPGNRWLWDGVVQGRVGIIERDGPDPDIFAETFDIAASYPGITGVTRETASQVAIETGLLYQFIEKSAWLFHQHLEPKYPDKYRPELDAKSKKSRKKS